MSQRTILQQHATISKILIFSGIACLSWGGFITLSLFIVDSIYHLPVFSNPAVLKDMSNPNVIGALKMMQIMQALGLFIIPAFVLSKLDGHGFFSYFQLNKKPFIYSFLCTLLIMLCAQPFINWLAEINSLIPMPENIIKAEKNAAEITETFLKMNTVSDLLFNLFMVALLPAIGEELLFRGAFQPMFQKLSKNPHLGIWLAAILFSAVHMQFLGFFPRMFMGAAFGYLLMWSGTLWLPIIGHFINNGSAVLIAYFIQKNGMAKEVETVGAGQGGMIYVLVSVAMLIVLFYVVRKFEKEHENPVPEPILE